MATCSTALNRCNHQHPVVLLQLITRPVGAAQHVIVDGDGNTLQVVYRRLLEQRFRSGAAPVERYLLIVEQDPVILSLTASFTPPCRSCCRRR